MTSMHSMMQPAAMAPQFAPDALVIPAPPIIHAPTRHGIALPGGILSEPALKPRKVRMPSSLPKRRTDQVECDDCGRLVSLGKSGLKPHYIPDTSQPCGD